MAQYLYLGSYESSALERPPARASTEGSGSAPGLLPRGGVVGVAAPQIDSSNRDASPGHRLPS